VTEGVCTSLCLDVDNRLALLREQNKHCNKATNSGRKLNPQRNITKNPANDIKNNSNIENSLLVEQYPKVESPPILSEFFFNCSKGECCLM
jgi:hypothetical protein